MRFCMRKQCCSSLRQGSLFQATLISSVACVDDVFLSLILLISLSSIQQGLRQPILSITERRLLLRPSLPVGHWLEPTWRIDHHQESITGLLRSDLLLFAVLGGYCPPCAVRHGVRRWRSRLTTFHELHGRCANTILVKPLSPRRLVHHDDGSVIPSIHSLVREHFTVTARFRLLLPRTGSFLASHPALWIEVQSLPQGCHFLVPIHQVRTCTSHQQISCVAVHLRPAHPHACACFGLTDRTRHRMLDIYGPSK